MVDQPPEESRDLIAGASGFGLRLVWRRPALYLTIEKRRFDHAQALHLPAGGNHLVQKAAFDQEARLIGI